MGTRTSGSVGGQRKRSGPKDRHRASGLPNYKAHLTLLARHGWTGVSELVRNAHRADLHQALAYAALADVDRVDTVLLYPHLGQSEAPPPSAVATVAAGRRRVRLVLGGLPFGFRTPARSAAALKSWRDLLAA